MNQSQIIEAIGYLGSLLVLVSFLMSSVVKLRVVNAVGSIIFAVYALIIRSYPTALMNLCLVAINLRFLWKLRRADPSYRLVELAPGEGYVRDFLAQHAADIARCFPGRSFREEELNRAWLVCHGPFSAGLLLGTERDGVLDIALDYTTPAYRDCTVGIFMTENLPGIRAARYADAEPAHIPYLQKLGYREKNGVWEKTLG